MSLSSDREIGSETERRFSSIHMFLHCYKLREIERQHLPFARHHWVIFRAASVMEDWSVRAPASHGSR
jgi:hypothetical protein